MEAKLYVGNMSCDTTEEQLSSMFAEAGTVVAVDVIKDRYSGKPKGFAFVTMGSEEDATNAINQFNGKEVNGRTLTVNIARPREERPGGGRSNRPDRRGGGGGYGNSNRRY